MKFCRDCGDPKPESAFSSDGYGGRRSRCKPCDAARVQAYKAANPARVLAKDRRRYATHAERLCREKREYAQRHPDRIGEKWRRQEATGQGHARKLLRHAVRTGKIIKPQDCERCHRPARLHGHHDDYCKPLAVQWVCPRCHGEIHRRATPPPRAGREGETER